MSDETKKTVLDLLRARREYLDVQLAHIANPHKDVPGAFAFINCRPTAPPPFEVDRMRDEYNFLNRVMNSISETEMEDSRRLDYDPFTAAPNKDGSIREVTGDAVGIGGWMVDDRTNHHWMIHNGDLIYSLSREDLIGWRRILRGQDPWVKFGPGSNCYSDGPVWSIRRSHTGIVMISSDGYGLDILRADMELKEDE